MSEAQVTDEIARMAREVRESIGQFTGLDELLRSTLPRLADPEHGAEFDAAVKELTERLDDAAVHQLSMLLSELWLYWNTRKIAEYPTRPSTALAKSPSTHPGLDTPSRAALPEIMETVVNLAAYAGTAAIGGVIGNRADARVQRMLAGARERWRARRGRQDTALTRDEAIEVVHAAAAVHAYDTDGAELIGAEQRRDGFWLVRFRLGAETLTAVVPPGDPGRARVAIRIS